MKKEHTILIIVGLSALALGFVAGYLVEHHRSTNPTVSNAPGMTVQEYDIPQPMFTGYPINGML